MDRIEWKSRRICWSFRKHKNRPEGYPPGDFCYYYSLVYHTHSGRLKTINPCKWGYPISLISRSSGAIIIFSPFLSQLMVILLLLLIGSFWSYDGFRSLRAVFFYSWLMVQLKKPSEEGKPYISGLYFIICSHSFAPFEIVVSLLTGSFSALCGTNNGKTSAEAYYCATDQCYDKCCKSKHILSPFVVGVSLFLIRIIRCSSLQNACRTKYFFAQSFHWWNRCSFRFRITHPKSEISNSIYWLR